MLQLHECGEPAPIEPLHSTDDPTAAEPLQSVADSDAGADAPTETSYT
jgi:hypothetical protein